MDGRWLWTIQHVSVWKLLQERRVLYRDEVPGAEKRPMPYLWLENQMKGRLNNYGGHPLWWAYCQKPDLRRHRHVYADGEPYVRLELDASRIPHVWFPSWAWNQVFCQDFLAYSRKEYTLWKKRVRAAIGKVESWPLPEPWRSELEASWERLFDPKLPHLGWDKRFGWSRNVRLEAVFEVLRLETVKRVTIFKGAAKWLRIDKGKLVFNAEHSGLRGLRI